MTRPKIEFIQPNPRVEDWRVKLDGRTAGSVWRCRDHYIASVTNQARLATLGDAFKEARRQARLIAIPEKCASPGKGENHLPIHSVKCRFTT